MKYDITNNTSSYMYESIRSIYKEEVSSLTHMYKKKERERRRREITVFS